MKFNRSELIAAIDKAMEQEETAIAAIRRRNKASDDAHAAEWLSLHGEIWATAATAIRAKLRRGEPITEDDIPRDRTGYAGKAYYRPKRGESQPARNAELAGLRAVLVAVSDEEIGSTSLRSLGVGANTLRLVVPLLGAASIRNEALRAHNDKAKAGKG